MFREEKVCVAGDSLSAIDALVAANLAFAAAYTFTPIKQPRVALVLCMDARIDPVRALGIPQGEVHIIRNAGGRVADAVRSLIVSQQVIGTEEVAIVHHTDCGMARVTDDEIRATLRERFAEDPPDIAFLSFGDLEDSVREDVALYRRTPHLRQDVPVRGFIYDVATGRLIEVA
jgi:carbonic anhydrase